MMNEIFQDLINTGAVRSFIDNIIEEHNKVVEKVVKKLAESNVYVKPEKYK